MNMTPEERAADILKRCWEKDAEKRAAAPFRGLDVEIVEAILDSLKVSEARRMEQAAQIMQLMADLSSARTEAAKLQELIAQHHRDNEGHNHCWRNNFRLWEGARLKPKTLQLPPRDEAEHGCKAFWDELYSTPDRWPDFISVDALSPKSE